MPSNSGPAITTRKILLHAGIGDIHQWGHHHQATLPMKVNDRGWATAVPSTTLYDLPSPAA